MVCQSSMTDLLEEAASFFPGYECNSPVAPSGCDRVISGYRLVTGPLPFLFFRLLYSYILMATCAHYRTAVS